MKIAVLTTGMWPYLIGGMQKHSYYLCKYLAAKHIYLDVYHFAIENTNKPQYELYFSQEELNYLTFIEVPFPKKDKFWGHYIRNSKRHSKAVFAQFMQREMPNFVYIQGFAGWELLLAKQKGQKIPPTLLNFHGLEMYQFAADWKGKLTAFIFRPFIKENLLAADYVQSLGGKLTQIIEKQGVKANNILSLGIGLSQDWLFEGEIKVNPIRKFVFVGRYERRKGIEELSEVLKNIGDNVPFEFHFIGQIPPEKQVKKENLFYHGQIKEQSYIQNLLQSADVFVCPSYAEGMPTVILEAMASGCAIIAADVGAVAETVDSTNGWLLPYPDITLLQNAINEALVCDATKLINYKNKSIAKVKQHFLWDNVINKLLSFIKAKQNG